MKVMDFNDIPTTKPYLLRAIHEWCSHNGYTPYMAVSVDHTVEVPMAFVSDSQIVLNVSYGATQGLELTNDMVSFKGRFGGKVQDIFVPISRVLAIYARENGQGMAFPATETPSADITVASSQQPGIAAPAAKGPTLVSVAPVSVDKKAMTSADDNDSFPKPPSGGGGLRRVK
tara:strand:+ start:525 stop:1043 length:519 start_codon:yes stop_codon:yes gene_type:complete